jgi:Adaptor complexes medium subunit family
MCQVSAYPFSTSSRSLTAHAVRTRAKFFGCKCLTICYLQVNVKLKGTFTEKQFALNVVTLIPVPDHTAKADIQVTQVRLEVPLRWRSDDWFLHVCLSVRPSVCRARASMMQSATRWSDRLSVCLQGKAKYDAKRHALVWKVKRFSGQSEQALIAQVDLIATTKEKKPWGRPPIQMSFNVSASCHGSLMASCGGADHAVQVSPSLGFWVGVGVLGVLGFMQVGSALAADAAMTGMRILLVAVE